MAEINENENILDEVRTETPEETADFEEIPEQSEKNIKGNYKTLQQLALEYGITRQGMKARLKKMLKEVSEKGLNESDYVSRGQRNTVYVLEPGLIWFAKTDAENSPMKPPAQNIDLELYKLEKAEERAKDLETQNRELRNTINFLQSEIMSKGNTINGLTATIAQQSKTIDKQNERILALTASKEDPEPSEDTATETPPQKAPEGAETPVSISEDELRAEVAKKSFWGKLALLFG